MRSSPFATTPDQRIILPFFGTGALFFLLLSILLFFGSSELTGHYFAPFILAMVHTAALGWSTMIIFGASYQLLPVICGRKLFSTKLVRWSYYTLTPGTILIIWSFWNFNVGSTLIIGGGLVVIASLLYAVIIVSTVFQSDSTTIEKHFLLSSALWLVITTGIGLLLAIHLNHSFIPRNHLEILKLHAHAGLAGWFLQLITGVSLKLVPMFLLGKSKLKGLLYIALIFQNLGLILFLADGYFNPIHSGTLLYAFLVGIGILAWIIYLADTFFRRMKKKVDILIRTSMLSFLWLVSSLAILPCTFTSSVRWSTLYGIFLFLGWITSLILGMTFKTLPFMIWNHHFKKAGDKTRIPLPNDLYNKKLVTYQFYLYGIAFIGLVTGLMAEWNWLIQTALMGWIVLACLYVFNVGKTIFYKPS